MVQAIGKTGFYSKQDGMLMEGFFLPYKCYCNSRDHEDYCNNPGGG